MAKSKLIGETTHPFSIYLLKKDISPDKAIAKAEQLNKVQDASKLPKGAELYLLNGNPKPPWWQEYFGIQQDMTQIFKGALVFLPVADRWFALVFGNAQHHLDDYAYEYDFGLKVTLNSLDPGEIKSADSVQPGGAKRRRTQVPSSTELTYLDFDGNSEIIKSLTGKVKKEYRELFKNATGSDGLRVSMKLSPESIPKTCKSLIDLYNDDSYEKLFPNIRNIAPVKDPEIKDRLNAELLDAVRGQHEDIELSIPEVIDYRESSCCLFKIEEFVSDVYPDISKKAFFEFFDEFFEKEEFDVDFLRNARMLITDSEGRGLKSFSLYRCFIFEFYDEATKARFHFCDGQWFEVDSGFLNRMALYLDAFFESADLCPYNHDKEVEGKRTYSEGKYNLGAQESCPGFYCLDLKDISPVGESQVEPCDLIRSCADENSKSGRTVELTHVKISTRSSSLSHLFLQSRK